MLRFGRRLAGDLTTMHNEGERSRTAPPFGVLGMATVQPMAGSRVDPNMGRRSVRSGAFPDRTGRFLTHTWRSAAAAAGRVGAFGVTLTA